MNYLSEDSDFLAKQRREDDLRILPITQSDILSIAHFNAMAQNPNSSKIVKLRLDRHDRALLAQSLNL